MDLNLKLDLLWYDPLTPLPPASQRLEAPIDAVVIQIGATLRW